MLLNFLSLPPFPPPSPWSPGMKESQSHTKPNSQIRRDTETQTRRPTSPTFSRSRCPLRTVNRVERACGYHGRQRATASVRPGRRAGRLGRNARQGDGWVKGCVLPRQYPIQSKLALSTTGPCRWKSNDVFVCVDRYHVDLNLVFLLACSSPPRPPPLWIFLPSCL